MPSHKILLHFSQNPLYNTYEVVVMNKHIPYNKLSKKAQRELDNQQRMTWNGLNPITRKIESKKLYRRKKTHEGFDDSCYGSFCFARRVIVSFYYCHSDYMKTAYFN